MQLEQVYTSLNKMVCVNGTTIGLWIFGSVASIVALLLVIYGMLKTNHKYKVKQVRKNSSSKNENIELLVLNDPVQQVLSK